MKGHIFTTCDVLKKLNSFDENVRKSEQLYLTEEINLPYLINHD